MTNPLFEKRILLGVTGSIACYKAADLASKLTQVGAQVDVILTQAATHFVTPLTFQSVTGRRAYLEADLWGDEAHILHIDLGHQADLLMITPATANTLAKLAHGLADNLLTITSLAATCPLLIAPAMDGGMYNHPATQANLELLRKRGAHIVGPAEGHLASGLAGIGRMMEPLEILGQARLVLTKNGSLNGRKIVVTAGGTQEPIDPVRVITNRSSGKQGFALAQAALDLGAQVTLITAPTALPTPAGAVRVEINTAEEMLAEVLAAIPQADALLMAAAVADFKPLEAANHKIKKATGAPEIRLTQAPDILAAVAEFKTRNHFPRITVGFAAESQDLLQNALAKLQGKHLDLIVANDITATNAGFSAETNQVTLLDTEGGVEALPLMSKAEVADLILARVEKHLLKENS